MRRSQREEAVRGCVAGMAVIVTRGKDDELRINRLDKACGALVVSPWCEATSTSAFSDTSSESWPFWRGSRRKSEVS